MKTTNKPGQQFEKTLNFLSVWRESTRKRTAWAQIIQSNKKRIKQQYHHMKQMTLTFIRHTVPATFLICGLVIAGASAFVYASSTCDKKLEDRPAQPGTPGNEVDVCAPIGTHYPTGACSFVWYDPTLKDCVDANSGGKAQTGKKCATHIVTVKEYTQTGNCDGAGECESDGTPSSGGNEVEMSTDKLVSC